jgi:hypothetical protein
MEQPTTAQIYEEILRVKKYLVAAMQHNDPEQTHTYRDIADGIISGRYHLWTEPHSAAITEFVYFPRRKYLHIFLCGGDLTEIKGRVNDIKAFAKATDCDGVSVSGRPGWVKALKDFGFTSKQLVYVTCEDL